VLVDSTRRGLEWEDARGRFCLFTHQLPTNSTESRPAQTRQVFQQLERLLSLVRMDFSQVVRTWFYLDRLLDWYDDFNGVRSQFYGERGLLGRCPASTAVGVSNDAGAALLVHLLAFEPRHSGIVVAPADSPRQGSALDYGSAFSRATKLRSSTTTCLYVSGTASIDPQGRTLFEGNTARQTEQTFAVVGALLSRHGLGFSDVTCATGYLPDLTEVPLVRPLWTQHLALPLNLYQADICRRELRFELELCAEKSPC
jgi:enamine deaminase RidA (YjgF/YER057c/UK114 family)